MSLAGNLRLRPVTLKRKDHLVHADKEYRHCFIVTEGMIARERVLSSGCRQIVGLLVPGDVCCLTVLSADRPDHDLVALCPVSCIPVEGRWVASLARTATELCEAIWREMSREAALSASWTANVGQRTSYQRVAHLICEIEARQRHKADDPDEEVEWPGTQADLCAASGLSLVHVNRTLQKMRDDGLATCGSRPRFRNVAKLRDIAGFDPAYLDCKHERLGKLLISRVLEDAEESDDVEIRRSLALFGGPEMQRDAPF